jgi:hypothetical protein
LGVHRNYGGTYIGQFQPADPATAANRTYDSNWPTHTLTLNAGWTDRTIFVYDKAAVGSSWSTPATWFACGTIPDNLPTTGWVPPALTLKPGTVNRAGPTQLPLLTLSAPNRSWTFKGNLPFDPAPFGYGYSNGDCKGGGVTFIGQFYPDQTYNQYGKDTAIKVDAVNRILTLRVPWNVRTVFVYFKSPIDIWAKPEYWYACGTIPNTMPTPPDK